MAVRAKAWSLCVEDTERFTFGQAFKAYVTGDAVGNIMPLGPLASEGTKALLIRRNIATSAAFSSVVLENIFYSISVAIMVMVGTLAFLLGYRPTNAELTITLSLGAVAVVSVVAVWWLLRSEPRLLSHFSNTTPCATPKTESSGSQRRARNASGRFCCCSSPFTSRGSGDLFSAQTARGAHRPHLLHGGNPGRGRTPHHDRLQVRALRLGVDHAGSGRHRRGARHRRTCRRDDRHSQDGAELILGGGGIGDVGEEYAESEI